MTTFIGANITQTYTTAQLQYGNAPGKGDTYETRDGKRYRFVLFDNGAGNVAAVAGMGAFLLGTGGQSTGATETVTLDKTDALNSLASVLAGVFTSVPADGEYCWIQTWGVCTLATTLLSGADGFALGGGVSGGTDGVLAHVETASSATAAFPQYGYIIDATAKIVFLRCS